MLHHLLSHLVQTITALCHAVSALSRFVKTWKNLPALSLAPQHLAILSIPCHAPNCDFITLILIAARTPRAIPHRIFIAAPPRPPTRFHRAVASIRLPLFMEFRVPNNSPVAPRPFCSHSPSLHIVRGFSGSVSPSCELSNISTAPLSYLPIGQLSSSYLSPPCSTGATPAPVFYIPSSPSRVLPRACIPELKDLHTRVISLTTFGSLDCTSSQALSRGAPLTTTTAPSPTFSPRPLTRAHSFGECNLGEEY